MGLCNCVLGAHVALERRAAPLALAPAPALALAPAAALALPPTLAPTLTLGVHPAPRSAALRQLFTAVPRECHASAGLAAAAWVRVRVRG